MWSDPSAWLSLFSLSPSLPYKNAIGLLFSFFRLWKKFFSALSLNLAFRKISNIRDIEDYLSAWLTSFQGELLWKFRWRNRFLSSKWYVSYVYKKRKRYDLNKLRKYHSLNIFFRSDQKKYTILTLARAEGGGSHGNLFVPYGPVIPISKTLKFHWRHNEK